jgi:transcriptional regulator with GAF, ATPase, and Fis domain
MTERHDSHPALRRCVGHSDAIRTVLADVANVAATPCPVLIEGESGTGKELIAAIIHEISQGNSAPFVVTNCGAVPETLLESELYGHVAGAFTGAVRSHRGVFERAADGTVFLDEIGEMPQAAQVRLLRVLQEGTFIPVGGEERRRSRARVLAATHRDLRKGVRQGSFRKDLFYRLNVYPIRIPPLRSRREDIPPLIESFLESCAAELGLPCPRLHPAALRRLMVYSYPGNVRELQNVVRALLIEAQGAQRILDRHVAAVFFRHRLQESDLAKEAGPAEGSDADRQTRPATGPWVLEQLRRYGFNVALAERLLCARKRNALDSQAIPVCSRSGLTYYLQGEALRALAEERWDLDAAAMRVAEDAVLESRVRSKLERLIGQARKAVAQGGAAPGRRLLMLRKAFVKLPQTYHEDLVRLFREIEKGRWSRKKPGPSRKRAPACAAAPD